MAICRVTEEMLHNPFGHHEYLGHLQGRGVHGTQSVELITQLPGNHHFNRQIKGESFIIQFRRLTDQQPTAALRRHNENRRFGHPFVNGSSREEMKQFLGNRETLPARTKFTAIIDRRTSTRSSPGVRRINASRSSNADGQSVSDRAIRMTS